MDRTIDRRAIDKQTIDEVRQLMTAIIGSEPDEMAHMELVVEHVLKLCKVRRLDPSLAEMAAMLHDVGRWISSEETGGHGKRGARLATRLLEPYELSPELVGTITRAIKNHTKKDRVDDDYSELIKDADALAHDAEAVDLAEKPMEAFRIKSMQKLSFGFGIEAGIDLEGIVDAQQLRIRQLISDTIDAGVLTQERAHELRVETRTYGALMDSIEVPEGLELLFKQAGKARNLKILMNGMMNAGASEHILEHLKEQEMNALDKTFQELPETLTILESIRPDMFELESLMEMTPVELGKDYMNALKEVDMTDSNSLHMLRILGKRYRSLMKLGIIGMLDDEDALLLEDLHDILGKLQDISSGDKLLRKLSLQENISKQELKAFRRRTEKRQKSLLDKAEVVVTMIRIRSNPGCRTSLGS